MSSDERRARKQAREEAQRERYEENIRYREDNRRRHQEERLTELEDHRNHSGEYLYGIYRWVRFGGIVLIIFLILTLLGWPGRARGVDGRPVEPPAPPPDAGARRMAPHRASLSGT